MPLYVGAGFLYVLLTARAWFRLYGIARAPLRWMLLGAALFLMGGVVLEISSYKRFHVYATPFWYHVEVAAEEFLEMAGASFLLFGVLELKRVLHAGESPYVQSP